MRPLLRSLFSSLARKIFVAVSVTLLVTGGIFVYVAHRTGFTMLEEQAHEKAHDIASVAKAILSSVMAEGKPAHLNEFLHALNLFYEVADVYVLRRDGTLYCGTDSSYQSTSVLSGESSGGLQGASERFISTIERGSSYEYVITPIDKQPLCYQCHTQAEPNRGYLAVKLSMDDLRATTLRHRATNIAMIIGTFLGVGGVIILMLLFVVVRPITNIRRKIKQLEEELVQVENGDQVELSQFAVPASKDEITDLIVAFNKLTKRLNEVHKRLHDLHQNELEHADRLASTGKMAASVAHEIKNPVAGVLGALQVFDGETPEGDPRKEILAEMKLQLERVDRAVNDLLSYARPTPPVFEQFSINRLIEKTVSLLSQQVNGKPITISTDLTGEEITLCGDKKQIQQLLWNLMLNGLQAIETSGNLTVSLSREDSLVRIDISDSGKGIPPELHDRIFKPFFTSKYKGTGLGMTISKRIVEQHHGSISVSSQAGKGTMVTIVLPALQNSR